jgi:putative mycofactocin binding protein MftB
MLDRRLALDPKVALRPEPFGALAYHYGTRKLVFLRHPDVVSVVEALDGETTVESILIGCGIDERRWPAFETALSSLERSEMLHECGSGAAG